MAETSEERSSVSEIGGQLSANIAPPAFGAAFVVNDRSVALEPVNVASVPVVGCVAPPPTTVFSSCATETSAECPENFDFPQVFVTDLVVQAHPAAVESV